MAIQTFIFDMGNVLIDYNPDAYTKAFFPNPDDAALATHVLFEGELWQALDAAGSPKKRRFPKCSCSCRNDCASRPGAVLRVAKLCPPDSRNKRAGGTAAQSRIWPVFPEQYRRAAACLQPPHPRIPGHGRRRIFGRCPACKAGPRDLPNAFRALSPAPAGVLFHRRQRGQHCGRARFGRDIVPVYRRQRRAGSRHPCAWRSLLKIKLRICKKRRSLIFRKVPAFFKMYEIQPRAAAARAANSLRLSALF